MNLLLITHALAALFTVVFAVYTGFHIFQRTSIEHRAKQMTTIMAPLLVRRIPKIDIVAKLKKEGFPEHEISELHDKLIPNFAPKQK